jgi:AraC-like DNA-binding protein
VASEAAAAFPAARRETDRIASIGIAGIGRILLWQGGSLWIGREAGVSTLHSHHAIQLTVALDDADGAFLLRDGPDDAWVAYEAAMVRPHHSHEFDGRGGSLAHVFVEPETTSGRRLVGRMSARGVTSVALDAIRAEVDALRRLWRTSTAGEDALVGASCGVVAALCGPMPAPAPVTPRISAAVDFIAHHIAQDLTLAQVAAAVNLSPSRLRHLFVAEVGTSFRGYVLWRRILVAVDAMMRGRSWTEAAHEAGFADSAHLSRTFRRTFGISPRMLLREAPDNPPSKPRDEGSP